MNNKCNNMLSSIMIIFILFSPIKSILQADSNMVNLERTNENKRFNTGNFMKSKRLIHKSGEIMQQRLTSGGNSSIACIQTNYKEVVEFDTVIAIHCTKYFEKLTNPKKDRIRNKSEKKVIKVERSESERNSIVRVDRTKRFINFESYYQHPSNRNLRKLSYNRRNTNNRIRHQMQSSFPKSRTERASFRALHPSYLGKVSRRSHESTLYQKYTPEDEGKEGNFPSQEGPFSKEGSLSKLNKKKEDKYKDIYLREGFITYEENVNVDATVMPEKDLATYRNVSLQPMLPSVLPLQSKAPDITWGRAQTHTASFTDPNPIDVSSRDGEQARLPCTVLHLGHGEVSWIRKRDLHILTVGRTTYTSDQRFRVLHGEGSLDWTLIIGPTTLRDAGIYECQVSTKPKISRPVNLIIAVERAEIQGPSEVFIRNGSTISLTCVVKSKSENLGSVAWTKEGVVLDYDSQRGGISLEVERTPTKSTTKLFITKARKSDSGVYVCSPQFAQPASVVVHVVNGEESAAVQTSESIQLKSSNNLLLSSFLFLISLSLSIKYTFLRYFWVSVSNTSAAVFAILPCRLNFYFFTINNLCKYLFRFLKTFFIFTKRKFFIVKSFLNCFLITIGIYFYQISFTFCCFLFSCLFSFCSPLFVTFLRLGRERLSFPLNWTFSWRRVLSCSYVRDIHPRERHCFQWKEKDGRGG